MSRQCASCGFRRSLRSALALILCTCVVVVFAQDSRLRKLWPLSYLHDATAQLVQVGCQVHLHPRGSSTAATQTDGSPRTVPQQRSCSTTLGALGRSVPRHSSGNVERTVSVEITAAVDNAPPQSTCEGKFGSKQMQQDVIQDCRRPPHTRSAMLQLPSRSPRTCAHDAGCQPAPTRARAPSGHAQAAADAPGAHLCTEFTLVCPGASLQVYGVALHKRHAGTFVSACTLPQLAVVN